MRKVTAIQLSTRHSKCQVSLCVCVCACTCYLTEMPADLPSRSYPRLLTRCAGGAEHYGKQEVRLLSGSVGGAEGRCEDSLVMDEPNPPLGVTCTVNSSTVLIHAGESVGYSCLSASVSRAISSQVGQPRPLGGRQCPHASLVPRHQSQRVSHDSQVTLLTCRRWFRLLRQVRAKPELLLRRSHEPERS